MVLSKLRPMSKRFELLFALKVGTKLRTCAAMILAVAELDLTKGLNTLLSLRCQLAISSYSIIIWDTSQNCRIQSILNKFFFWELIQNKSI